MNIGITGRNCDATTRFQEMASDKLAKLERFDHKLMGVDVVVTKETNRRQADQAYRVELTVRSKGPVIRAEAAAADRFAALDVAVDKLCTRMRKVADRRQDARSGGRNPRSVAAATAELPTDVGSGSSQGNPSDPAVDTASDPASDPASGPVSDPAGPLHVDGEGPLVVREKTHDAAPMTLGQALYEMELVGHDFYLYVDVDSRQPSVVYRRKGFDYGVIHLNV